MNNIKDDIEFIKSVFLSICEEFGNDMPEKFYERQMSLRVKGLISQPRINKVIPDAIYKGIVIEYKANHNVKTKNIRYQIRKYLSKTETPLVLLLDFHYKFFAEFYF